MTCRAMAGRRGGSGHTGRSMPTSLAASAQTGPMHAAFAALNDPGARADYDERRAVGDTHHRAPRALANRLVSILHGCLRHGALYDEDTARAHRV